jgi:hypothetical protein
MTTRVLSVVVTPNVHKARVSTQDKKPDGTWVETESRNVELGQTVIHDSYITDTRRIVIEEVPAK